MPDQSICITASNPSHTQGNIRTHMCTSPHSWHTVSTYTILTCFTGGLTPGKTMQMGSVKKTNRYMALSPWVASYWNVIGKALVINLPPTAHSHLSQKNREPWEPFCMDQELTSHQSVLTQKVKLPSIQLKNSPGRNIFSHYVCVYFSFSCFFLR